MEQTAAQAFFSQHKDLFEYDKYVGTFQRQAICERSGDTATKSFLDQYRELDHSRATALTLKELSFSLSLPIRGKYTIPSIATPSPEFFILQSPAMLANQFASNIPQKLASPQRIGHTSQQLLNSIFSETRLGCTHATHQDALSSTFFSSGQLHPDTLNSALRKRSLIRQSAEFPRKRDHDCMPKLSELLIDPETRASSVVHKILDEVHKIEVLTGGKCVGRVNAASRNIPMSIRTRLNAAANVSVRREKLYELLRRDYEQLSTCYVK